MRNLYAIQFKHFSKNKFSSSSWSSIPDMYNPRSNFGKVTYFIDTLLSKDNY